VKNKATEPHDLQWFLFDLDGTLIDTSELIDRSADQALIDCLGQTPQSGGEPIPQGLPLEEHLRSLIRRTTKDGQCGKGLESAVEASFFGHYRTNLDNYLKAFDGILPLLHRLLDCHKDLAVVSSKRRQVGEMELQRTGLSDFFRIQVFVQDVARPKPNPDGIFRILDLAGPAAAGRAARESMIMIGDSRYDIEAAQNAGVRSVCACWGWRDFDAQMRLLQDVQPTYFAMTPLEILRLVDGASKV